MKRFIFFLFLHFYIFCRRALKGEMSLKVLKRIGKYILQFTQWNPLVPRQIKNNLHINIVRHVTHILIKLSVQKSESFVGKALDKLEFYFSWAKRNWCFNTISAHFSTLYYTLKVALTVEQTFLFGNARKFAIIFGWYSMNLDELTKIDKIGLQKIESCAVLHFAKWFDKFAVHNQ